MLKTVELIQIPARLLRIMGVGGHMNLRQPPVQAELNTAYTGVTRFASTGWFHCRNARWVLDYINHGQQRQRVGSGREFVRLNGVAALYSPRCAYHEWQEAGTSLDESYIIFTARGTTECSLRELLTRQGCCHLQDPNHVLGELLRLLGEALFSRAGSFQIVAHALFCQILAGVLSSERLSPDLRRVTRGATTNQANDFRTRAEQFIRERITEPLRVADLARQFNMSSSAFAHFYAGHLGEAPHRTVLRLKMETAKRLLMDEGRSVKEIAEHLGFSSEFHFSHAFKHLEGLAPSHYRAAMTQRKN
jgi:AraC-like DNA-binding protein